MQALIVDDDMAIVDAVEQTIHWKRLGIEKVYTAYNIESAKAILSKQQIDIIISDIEMPQGSGLDLLSWLREQHMQGEFLLLTCHERFDYATNAVKLHAAEYLLKPFDVAVMEAALKKIILKAQEERQLKENSEVGKWAKKNWRKLRLALLNRILTGHISSKDEEIRREIESGNLKLDAAAQYSLAVSKVTDVEMDKQKINPELILFIMENIHSEILCGNPENDSVVCYEYKNHYVLVTICEITLAQEMEQKCRALLSGFGNILSATLTCCISNPCRIADFYATYRRNLQLIESNVIYYGSFFQEGQGISRGSLKNGLLEADKMEELLNEKRKRDFLSCLKEVINDMVLQHAMDELALKQIKQEVLQVIYTWLGKKEISVSGLLMEGDLTELAEKAARSVTDMIRWVNFLLESTFAYEEEMRKKYTIVDQIEQYVREHYQENIGRNEIAERFYLAPEYLSKMYKKKRGRNLKDYINQYRIEQAKRMLEKGERVSDAAEAAGFDNFTYFSTMFKKYTGVSPNQYRKK